MEGSRRPGGAIGPAPGSFPLAGVASPGSMRPEQCVYAQRVLLNPKRSIAKDLGEIIAGEIVPRLRLRHGSQSMRTVSCTTPAVQLSSEVADFADLVVKQEPEVAGAYIKQLMRRGLDIETVLLHLLAPAARRLGQLWEADEIGFVDVTIGTSRLQTLLHQLRIEPRKMPDEPNRTLLLLPAPGEQHTFGLIMASELFRRQGWQVHPAPSADPEEIISLISHRRFAVIGLSLGCDSLIKTLCSFIQAVRRRSKNRSVQIMVGGRVFAQDPEFRPALGADFVASDVREALVLAEGAFKGIFR